MDLEKRYSQSEDIVSRTIGEDTILVPIHRQVGELENVYALNDTAAFIWGQMDGKSSLGDICNRMESEFEVDRERAERDLLTCVAQFEEMKSIVPVD